MLLPMHTSYFIIKKGNLSEHIKLKMLMLFKQLKKFTFCTNKVHSEQF